MKFNAFKLYMLDVGLLGALVGLSTKALLEGDAMFTEFKGALTEQFICQEIIAQLNSTPYYWSAAGSSAEVDFLLQQQEQIIPIEVKATENLNAKSLKSFITHCGLPYGVRTSLSDYREEERLINLPLYAFSQLYNLPRVLGSVSHK